MGEIDGVQPLNNTGRIQLIDALRGLSLVLMCVHHFALDLYGFGWLPRSLMYSDIVYVLHVIFASVFVLLAGVSSRFSKSNIKRGIKVLVYALVITLATWAGEKLFETDMLICWGILHMLGVCMIFYGLCRKWLDKFNWEIAVPVYFTVFLIMCFTVLDQQFEVRGLSILIMRNSSFKSADYFALFPWILMFLIGAQLGELIRNGRFPKWFYDSNPPVLPAIGRKSLLIYMLHQPVLYGITYAVYLMLQ